MKKAVKILSVLMTFIMLFSFIGCDDSGKKAGVNNQNSKTEGITSTENGTVNENNDTTETGKVVASVMKTVNGRQVVYHNGKPFLYTAAHLRYDHLTNYVSNPDKALADGMRLIKENGMDAVIIYVSWGKIYDGKKYDLTWFTKQFKEAEKNDLKVVINWFGSNVCGFGGYQSWQKNDYNKYPSLLDDSGKPILGTGYAEGKRIPDFSAEIYAFEEGQALTQICNWLYENDKARRTVAIQICDEPNSDEGGHGQWMSQFKTYADYMDKLAGYVKNSKYSMVTNTVLMGAGYNDVLDGYTYKQRVKYLIDLPNLDFVGYSIYQVNYTPSFSEIEQTGNLPSLIGLGAAAWCAPAQTLYCLQNAYGYCYYQFINFNEGDWGYYSVKGDMVEGTIFGIRDGTAIIDANNFKGELEADHKEMLNMNTCIYKMDELLAVTASKKMSMFNNKAKNDFSGKKTIDGEKVTFTYKNTAKKYGGCGLMLKADDGNFYGFATLDATFTFTSDITVTVGYYNGDKWVSEGEVQVSNKSFTAKAGKVYQVVLK